MMATTAMSAPPLNTYASLVSTFGSFLTVAIHTILYERDIYPRFTFLSARKYNYPVRQNRHPKVCAWINDAVAAVEAELLKSAVARVAVVIYSPTSIPLERFMFDVSGFPSVPPSETLTVFEERVAKNASKTSTSAANPIDLEEQFRGVVSKLAYCGDSLGPLPEGCSFTVCIELKDEAEAPLGHPQPWIPSVPSLQRPAEKTSERVGQDRGGVRTTPIRYVEAGEFLLDLWIEEGREKKKLQEGVTEKTNQSG
ncbi:MAG: hypothetical protein M1823_004645 [Watsoniomyces obsoletus]|nr:MAG: hypothetical protein M1823_004645 [Watsoniomyces obsoletus]